MKKKYCIISNVVLLLWYFLAMIGVDFGNKYLVTSSYKEEWFFMVIPLVIFIVFVFKEQVGKYLLLIWNSMWLITQFLSHEWYTIFRDGFMGSTEGKIEYFKDAIKIFTSETVYIPDVYHIILHILIIIALTTTIIYSFDKKSKTKSYIPKNKFK
ncbi:hypothetical protein [Terrisporobacter petrolearius]|uniref:hypothetical protein n=1 Tax=Terrisporobacter TaxID=1505652 RepID=UPI001D164CBC|nr:hypothetical protein [Terrisporobacter petrolearius]MCC3866189.1 hypothetical protein [Terrisporobacter petrolearius]